MKKWINILGLIACLGAGYFLWGKTSPRYVAHVGKRAIVGGALCGICTEVGPHYWERDCDGKVTRTSFPDGHYDTCSGAATGPCGLYEWGKTEEGYGDILVATVECTKLFETPQTLDQYRN